MFVGMVMKSAKKEDYWVLDFEESLISRATEPHSLSFIMFNKIAISCVAQQAVTCNTQLYRQYDIHIIFSALNHGKKTEKTDCKIKQFDWTISWSVKLSEFELLSVELSKWDDVCWVESGTTRSRIDETSFSFSVTLQSNNVEYKWLISECVNLIICSILALFFGSNASSVCSALNFFADGWDSRSFVSFAVVPWAISLCSVIYLGSEHQNRHCSHLIIEHRSIFGSFMSPSNVPSPLSRSIVCPICSSRPVYPQKLVYRI